MMKKTQRFIAGATCPKCGEIDSLLVDTLDQGIECVDCGFQQSEAERDAESDKKDSTKIAKAAPKKVDVSSIIRITEIKD